MLEIRSISKSYASGIFVVRSAINTLRNPVIAAWCVALLCTALAAFIFIDVEAGGYVSIAGRPVQEGTALISLSIALLLSVPVTFFIPIAAGSLSVELTDDASADSGVTMPVSRRSNVVTQWTGSVIAYAAMLLGFGLLLWVFATSSGLGWAYAFHVGVFATLVVASLHALVLFFTLLTRNALIAAAVGIGVALLGPVVADGTQLSGGVGFLCDVLSWLLPPSGTMGNSIRAMLSQPALVPWMDSFHALVSSLLYVAAATWVYTRRSS